MRALPGVLVVAAALGSCSEGRPRQGELANPVSWEEEIGPLFAASCNSCHSGAAPAGNYRTTSYLDALGPYAAPVATAGDPDSPLLATIDPAHADAVHQPVSGAFSQAKAWVVDGKLSFFRSGTHEGGILNPHDPQFHSNLVEADGWNFSRCQGCHGDPDLSGGKAGVSCQECHSFQLPSGGAPTCVSCHGSAQSPAPPRDLAGNTASSALGVGAHQPHLFGKTVISGAIACSACHLVPTEVGSPGHLEIPLPAEVTFSGLALADGAAPVWDRNTATCSATYCHGGGAKLSADTAAHLQKPVWTGGTAQAFCGACHGIPPST
ncbi:MAG TPA: CxxxxCH/CxxCH domain-containing protein, partial [Terriglobales bacterium]|nr:CxxxxCH/CxxCH domain-containing protein [Terriglobales bacterium]